MSTQPVDNALMLLIRKTLFLLGCLTAASCSRATPLTGTADVRFAERQLSNALPSDGDAVPDGSTSLQAVPTRLPLSSFGQTIIAPINHTQQFPEFVLWMNMPSTVPLISPNVTR